MWVLLVLATTGMLLINGGFQIGDIKVVADIPQYVCWLPAGAAGLKIVWDGLITRKVFKEYKDIKKKMF